MAPPAGARAQKQSEAYSSRTSATSAHFHRQARGQAEADTAAAAGGSAFVVPLVDDALACWYSTRFLPPDIFQSADLGGRMVGQRTCRTADRQEGSLDSLSSREH